MNKNQKLLLLYGNKSEFFSKLLKNLLKYTLFILPFILISKSLYICWSDDIWNFTYFGQQFVSNVPFLGRIFSEYIWGNNLILSLDNIKNNQNTGELIFVGGLGSCLGKTIFEVWFSGSDYFKQPVIAGPIGLDNGEIPVVKPPLILKSTSGSNLNLSSGSAPAVPLKGSENVNVPERNVPIQKNVPAIKNEPAEGTGKNTSSTEFVPFIYSKEVISTFYTDISPGYESYMRVLKRMNDKTLLYTLQVPKNMDDPSITDTELAKTLFIVQKTHSDILTGAFLGRDAWLGELSYYLEEKDRQKMSEISEKISKAREDYLIKAECLGGSDPDKIRVELKRFFDYTNTYRNTVKKDLARADAIMKKGLKGHPLYKNKEMQKMINTDYPNLLKAFHDEDEMLKKRLVEVFNKPVPVDNKK